MSQPSPANQRRTLTFRSLDDLLADAEMLTASPTTRTLGKWPLEQLLTHLSSTLVNSLDGFQVQAPWIIRLIGPFLKQSTLKKMSPGIKLPKRAEAAAFPPSPSVADALRQLREAINRAKQEQMTANHPAFGKMTHDEWYQLHLRHSEMHLSFALPK